MSDYTNIIQEINTNIPDNTDQSITALKVRTTLIDMLDAVDDNMTEAIGEISVPTKTSDLTNDSGFITATSLEPFVTKTELSNASYVTRSELSSMSYATTSFVDGAIADAFEDSNFMTEADVDNLLSTASYVTSEQLSGMSYITNQDLAETLSSATYVTESQLQQAGYVSQSDISNMGYVTSTDLNNYDFATETYVADYVATHSGPIDLSSYVTKDELSQASYVTQSQLSSMTYVSQSDLQSQLADYATETYVADYVATHSGQIDLSSYVTKNELSNASYATTTQLNDAISGITVPTKTSDLTNDSGFITASALNGLATEQYVNTAVSGLATEQYVDTAVGAITVPTKTSDLTNDSGFITSSALSGLATETYVTNAISDIVIPTKTSDLTNDSGFITSIPAEYVTESELSAKGYITSSDIPAIPVIDESIIPNTTLTYTLGDSSHFYANTYTTDVWLSSKNQFSNKSDNQVNLMINNSWKYIFHSNVFSPVSNNNQTLGQSGKQWSYTYSANFIEDGTNIKDIYTQTEVVTQSQYDALTTEQKNSETIYVISDQQAYFDNELVTEQSLATKGFLTADNFQYDTATGTLTLVL